MISLWAREQALYHKILDNYFIFFSHCFNESVYGLPFQLGDLKTIYRPVSHNYNTFDNCQINLIFPYDIKTKLIHFQWSL